MPPDIYEYFDGYDAQMHGWAFLTEVLRHIANINAARAEEVQDLVNRWIASNAEALSWLSHLDIDGHGVKDLFSEEDIKDHVEDFLSDAIVQIRHMRRTKDREEHEERDRTYAIF